MLPYVRLRPITGFASRSASFTLLLALPFACLEAHAQSANVLRPYASYLIAYDDNVLGLPGGAASQAMTGDDDRSDTSKTASGGLMLENKIGQQHLNANLGLSATRYDRLRQLDHQGRNLSAQWNWHIGRHIDGNLGATYLRSLAPFTDFHQPEKNLRAQRRQDFDARWRFHPTWQVRGGLGQSEVSYNLQSQRSNEREEEYGEAGIDYVARSGSTFGVLVRHGRGKYPNPVQIGALVISNDYEQDEVRGRVDWLSTGKTRLLFSGGAVSRKHAMFAARDFRGSNARLSIDWLATGKLSVSAAVWRELGPVDDMFTAYSVNRGISIAPKWVITEKVQTEVQLRYEERDFRQSRAFLPTSDFTDTLKSASWSLQYMPAFRWLVQTSVFHTSKNAAAEQSSFTRNGLNASVQYQF